MLHIRTVSVRYCYSIAGSLARFNSRRDAMHRVSTTNPTPKSVNPGKWCLST